MPDPLKPPPPDDKAHASGVRLTDDDIGLVRAVLHCNLMGAASHAAPRSWLSEAQNSEVARQTNSFWVGIDAHYAQMAQLGAQHRPAQRGFSLYAMTHALQALASSQPLVFEALSVEFSEQAGSSRAPEALPYTSPSEPPRSGRSTSAASSSNILERDVSRCIARDLERTLGAHVGLLDLQSIPESRKEFIAETMMAKLQNCDKPELSDQATGRSNLWRLLPDAFSPKAAPALHVCQEGIDQRRLKLSERFGLDGVTIAQSACTTLRQQERWLVSAEKSLAEACRRLGIEEAQYGMDRRSSLEIDPPGVAANKGAHGQFCFFTRHNARINLSASSTDAPATLVHEFTHHLDNVLALKAHQAAPQAFSSSHQSQFFSELTPSQQAALPMARDGFAQVCKQTGHTPLLSAMRSWLGRGPQAASHREPFETLQAGLIEKALERFAVAHIGAEDYFKTSPAEHAQYKQSLMRSGPAAILEMAKGWSNKPMGDIAACMDNGAVDPPEQAGQTTQSPLGASHMDIARKLHGANEPVRRRQAIAAIEPLLVELGARLHPMMLVSAEQGASTPGQMMQSAVRQDRLQLDRGRHCYYTQPYEVLARMIARPITTSAVAAAVQTPWEANALSHGQIKQLSAGFEKMLDAAGVPRSGSPKLAAVSETPLFAALKLSHAVTHESEKFASRLSAMFTTKDPSPKRPPGPGA